MASSGADTARRTVSDKVARLNDVVLFGAFDDDEMAAFDAGLTALLDAFATDRPARPVWWESEDSASLGYWTRSPFAGHENPRAPGLDLSIERGEDGRLTTVGATVIDKAFAGPPGAVHGGILAGIFDEVAGTHADLCVDRGSDPNAVVVTGRLTIHYRRPTPLRTPLTFTATTPRITRRLIMVQVDCAVDDVVTAQAEALMVVRR